MKLVPKYGIGDEVWILCRIWHREYCLHCKTGHSAFKGWVIEDGGKITVVMIEEEQITYAADGTMNRHEEKDVFLSKDEAIIEQDKRNSK